MATILVATTNGTKVPHYAKGVYNYPRRKYNYRIKVSGYGPLNQKSHRNYHELR